MRRSGWLAVVAAGLVLVVVAQLDGRADQEAAARQIDAYSAAPSTTDPPGPAARTPSATASPSPSADVPLVAVIADGTALKSAVGTSGSQRWPALVARAVGATLLLRAASGRGYTAAATGGTFASQVDRVPADADVVLVVGGIADAGASAAAVEEAAQRVYVAARGRAPSARVIAVAPLLSGGVSTARLRNALRAAGRRAGVPVVDPIQQRWLDTASRRATSAAALSSDAEQTIADRLVEAMRSNAR